MGDWLLKSGARHVAEALDVRARGSIFPLHVHRRRERGEHVETQEHSVRRARAGRPKKPVGCGSGCARLSKRPVLSSVQILNMELSS